MSKRIIYAIMCLAVVMGCAGTGNTGKSAGDSDKTTSANPAADKLILGNIITMNEIKPEAEAMTVKDGIIQYVGSKEVAHSLCDDGTVVMDYGDNYIYPGFLESHAHGAGAGYRMAGQADLSACKTAEECAQVMKAWIDAHPGKDLYMGCGWAPWLISEPTKDVLDAVCPDKPVTLNSVDGHSMWVNSCLMAQQGIDKEYAKKMGPAQVHVDAEGNPTGLLTESAATALMGLAKNTVDDFKEFILAWQDFAFSNGYTAATEAGVELAGPLAKDAYVALSKEGKLKLRTYAYYLIKDDCTTPEAEVEEAAREAVEYNNEYFSIVGLKVFIDGVIEAHTGWLLEDYKDTPGNHGLERFHNHDIAVRLVKAASDHGMGVHAHTIGDGAVRFMMDAVAEAEIATGNFDQRNIFVHLQLVDPADIKRMADYNVIAGTAPLWTPKTPSVSAQEISYVGADKAEKAYPIKSFIDAGVVNVSHTDYPVSPAMSIPKTIYLGVTRASQGNPSSVRGPQECVTRMDVLKSLTTNVAYLWGMEDKLGSIEVGKVANVTVYDKDFLNGDLEEIPQATLVSTIVDGNIVFGK